MKTRLKKASSARTSAGAEARFAEVVNAFAADERLAPVARAYRAEQQSQRTHKFGSRALKVDGRMFALLAGGRLVVKLANDRVDDLVRARQGTYFDPGHGRPMKQWVVIAGSLHSWEALVREAHDFMRTLENRRPPAVRQLRSKRPLKRSRP
jgi:hypothetical protein